MSHKQRLIVTLAAAAGLASAESAMGLTFNFVPAGGMPQTAIDGFAEAGRRWSSVLADPVTININIDFPALPAGVLGSTSTTRSTYTYANTRTALINDASSADDTTSTGFLQAGPAMNFVLNLTSNNPNGAGSITPYYDTNASSNNTTIRAPHANAKALGLRAANDPAVDASISFSNAFTWDFDPKNGISPGSAFDFVGVATHEIGHALGFTSGVDVLDGNVGLPESSFTWVQPMDLFRYSAQSFANGAGVFDWSADTRTKYFSINGGTTSLTTFATGVANGDGRQASHWKDNLGIGIMDPTFANGEIGLMTARDLQMMDVIGWQKNNTWEWIDPAGGNFNSAIRWSSTIVPGAVQTAVWNLNNTYTMTLTGVQTTDFALFKKGTVTFANGGFTYSIGNELHVAPVAADNATVNIGGGIVAADDVGIGGTTAVAGGTGAVSINAGGALNVAQMVHIWPNGTLKYNGGTVAASQFLLRGGKIQTAANLTSGTTLTVTNGGTIQTDAGTTYTQNFLFMNNSGTLTKTGTGTWTLNAAQSNGVGTVLNANAGTTNINTNAGQSGANLTINANAVVTFGATQNLAALNVGSAAQVVLAASGSRSIKTPSLSVAALGKLDLTNNRMVVDYTGLSVAPAIDASLTTGRNDGEWNGFGIISSSAAGGTLFALGYGEAVDVLALLPLETALWGGQTVDASSVLVRFTYDGDANLDGTINADDYANIDFNAPIPGAQGYYNGDFNYDNDINADDYSVIDFNRVAQGAPLGLSADVDASSVAGLTSLPEPGACALAMIAAPLLLKRRQRRRSSSY